ncbi:MAG: lytic murein transglycosylase B [Aquabacterium sp.]|jgi:membrane-bound lytic murein transglycosylase B|uniref:lytic murein transglycosylase B n=1 Tax=Aquabacterium sp. TaxID=1872578 RepID=UPI001B4EDD2D|nr:lytic murein transglycosylase B [Aquabacterium sp.]MBP7132344.1 lytic murein transglycosylase B [Aquabacterium sp.]MBP9063544.1 lytic murein transglycosylase B [Aquabacterium sp.]MDQ5926367.1 rane-bound lytic murein transglycosylase [Pseudomonadota bacterium]
MKHSRHHPAAAIARWGWISLTTALLCACSTSRAPADHTEAAAPSASAPAASAPDAQVQRIHTPAIAPQVISLPADADAYSQRADARALASDIAQTHELDEAWVWSVLSEARYKSQAARLMMPAPRGTAKNWAAYRARFIEPIRIRAGLAFWQQHEAALLRAQAQYGVPADIIAGIIGVETVYGRHTGNFRVLDVLTTLSLDFPSGRSDRSPFFKKELGAFLKLCAEQQLAPDSVLGSYAGAIGWPQFMPSSIRRWGVDFDGNGQVDLQGSPVDAIGSVAHYLASHGWRNGQATHFDVTPPIDEAARTKLLAPDIVPSFSAAEMQALGAALPETALAHPGPLALVLLENGDDAPTLIAGTANFYAITRYNQSSYYALAVIELARALRPAAPMLLDNP